MAFLVRGGTPLYGEIEAQGAKNAVLPMLFATLLTRDPVTLYGVPQIGDVASALAVLRALGAVVEETCDGGITICTADAKPPSAALTEARRTRASSYLLGAALARFGEGSIPPPGGCSLGERPLDYHRAAFRSLGATWTEEGDEIRVASGGMKGTHFALPYPSVGATVNFILAALGAEGESTLYSFARERHVLDFILFLNHLGADIAPVGECLHIRGGKPLGGGSYRVTPDVIEAGSYLIAGALTKGEVTVRRVRYAELSPLLFTFGRMNVPFRFCGDAVTVFPPTGMVGTRVTASPYPGFPTDLHPPMTVLLSAAEGGGTVCDLVFEDRFRYVEELKKMGLVAFRSSFTLRVFQGKLRGAAVRAPDLRGGAALMLAALAAEGESRIEGEECIERGYERLTEKLFSLGAAVSRI